MDNARPTVVVIDDSQSVHLFFQRCAEPMPVRLLTFTSASDAVDELKTTRPALMFLDIIMPDMHGLTFLQEFRRMPGQQDTPVIVISSKDYAQDRSVAKALGAVEFVVKPMSTQTIRDLIVRYTGVVFSNGAR
jgi:CheY-like chemotaxis protein